MSIFDKLPRTESGGWPEVDAREIIQVAQEFTDMVDGVFEDNAAELDPESGISRADMVIEGGSGSMLVKAYKHDLSMDTPEERRRPLASRTLKSIVIDKRDSEGQATDSISYNLMGDGVVRRWATTDDKAVSGTNDLASILEEASTLGVDINFGSFTEAYDYYADRQEATEQAEEVLGLQNTPATLGEMVRLRQLLLGDE